MLKIRKELDHLLDNNKYHFGIDNNKRLCIKSKCGKTIVTFYDIRFSGSIPNSEVEYAKKILIDRIDEINKKLKRLEELREEIKKYEPDFIISNYYDGNNYCVKLYKNDNEARLDKEEKQIVEYRFNFKNIDEIKKIKEEFDEYFEQYKKWKKIIDEINKLEEEINQCEI